MDKHVRAEIPVVTFAVNVPRLFEQRDLRRDARCTAFGQRAAVPRSASYSATSVAASKLARHIAIQIRDTGVMRQDHASAARHVELPEVDSYAAVTWPQGDVSQLVCIRWQLFGRVTDTVLNFLVKARR